ncbi:kinase-like domain-containing protein [Glomus cerebriforme]|uniref:Kinase-like domain-containing protein n=1 Tax=Glomus cerebriforme TaxID=658196 RepID=A0A397T1A1_9GLOM|nr:kinase-like domain-containing protein [Glomus cerebriforme]
MEFINANDDSFDPTPKLRSSPILIDFVSFNQNDINCNNCGNKYSETLLFEQKYCKGCLLGYLNKIIIDNYTYLDLHISVINSECTEHKTRDFFTQEWCDSCSVISFFKQIPTNSLAYYNDDFSFEEQNKIIESEKYCKLCRKLIYQNSLLFEKLKMCSDCYQISYELIPSTTTNEITTVLYLPWWDAFYICIICKIELIFDVSQKWCPHCFIIYSGCRYCLTTNIIFGFTGQSQCKKCKRIVLITINNSTLSIGNNEIDNFIYKKRNKINNCDNVDYMKDINKYDDNPLNVYDFLKEKIYINFDPEAVMEWIPYSRIKILNKIAEEKFINVYKATWLNGGIYGANYSHCNREKSEIITIKKFINSQDINKYLFNELKSYHQRYNKSGHILRYYGIAKDPVTKEYILAMKYADGGNLHNYLQKNFKNITWKEKLEILLQISNGLKTIHDVNLAHQSFHSENILLVESYQSYQKWQFGQWLIGLSQPADDASLNNVSNKIIKDSLLKESDIYSMSMIMWECTTGYRPFANIEYNTGDIINEKRPEITDDTPECFANLMKSCWDFDPKKRPSIIEICKIIHDWFIMEKNTEQFNQAEKKRLELIQLEDPYPEFTDKHYSKAASNKSLKDMISGSSTSMNSMSLFNMKLESSLKSLGKEHEKNDIQSSSSSSSENMTNSIFLANNYSKKHNIEEENNEIQNNG